MGESFRARNKQGTSLNWTPLCVMVDLESLFGDERGHRAYTPHTCVLIQTTFELEYTHVHCQNQTLLSRRKEKQSKVNNSGRAFGLRQA